MNAPERAGLADRLRSRCHAPPGGRAATGPDEPRHALSPTGASGFRRARGAPRAGAAPLAGLGARRGPAALAGAGSRRRLVGDPGGERAHRGRRARRRAARGRARPGAPRRAGSTGGRGGAPRRCAPRVRPARAPAGPLARARHERALRAAGRRGRRLAPRPARLAARPAPRTDRVRRAGPGRGRGSGGARGARPTPAAARERDTARRHPERPGPLRVGRGRRRGLRPAPGQRSALPGVRRRPGPGGRDHALFGGPLGRARDPHGPRPLPALRPLGPRPGLGRSAHGRRVDRRAGVAGSGLRARRGPVRVRPPAAAGERLGRSGAGPRAVGRPRDRRVAGGADRARGPLCGTRGPGRAPRRARFARGHRGRVARRPPRGSPNRRRAGLVRHGGARRRRRARGELARAATAGAAAVALGALRARARLRRGHPRGVAHRGVLARRGTGRDPRPAPAHTDNGGGARGREPHRARLVGGRRGGGRLSGQWGPRAARRSTDPASRLDPEAARRGLRRSQRRVAPLDAGDRARALRPGSRGARGRRLRGRGRDAERGSPAAGARGLRPGPGAPPPTRVAPGAPASRRCTKRPR